MAHISEVTGKYSELVAEAAFVANGFRVSKPNMSEPHDLSAVDPLNGIDYKYQVKTIRVRADRKNELVIYSQNGRGEAYSKTDVDAFVGVLVRKGDPPRVFVVENDGVRKEIWASEQRAAKRWVELPITLDRSTYVDQTG